MPHYIVCQKKRNNPRMDIRICQKKCDLKNDCKEYLAFDELPIHDNDISLSGEQQSIQLRLALDAVS